MGANECRGKRAGWDQHALSWRVWALTDQLVFKQAFPAWMVSQRRLPTLYSSTMDSGALYPNQTTGYPSTPPAPRTSTCRQLKQACTQCQKSAKKCDNGRPCLRCVKNGKNGVPLECTDAPRKTRGKRSSYRKRSTKGKWTLTNSISDYLTMW